VSRTLTIRRDVFPIAGRFAISRGARTEARVVVAEIAGEGYAGRGECVPYARYGESVDSVIAQIEDARAAVEAGAGREDLYGLLPAGAARNAVDCALWDLEAKRQGVRVWELAGLKPPQPVQTAYTLSIDAPEAMRAKAAEHAWRPLLKVKLGGEGDLDRLLAVRQGAPDAKIVVDANEGWTLADYTALAPEMVSLGVAMVEQPLPADADAPLAESARPLPVCADESCHDRASLPKLAGRYDFVNIKLDKTGGLTEALALKAAAEAAGYRIMVGCMLASSLAMAPAILLAQGAEVVDLDGPLLLAEDRPDAIVYDAAGAHPPVAALWG
jgi:L-alanine-DL-glutamate epimerase-like enolase superfamily enzyme